MKHQPKMDRATSVFTREDCGQTPVQGLTLKEVGASEVPAVDVDKVRAAGNDVEDTDLLSAFANSVVEGGATKAAVENGAEELRGTLHDKTDVSSLLTEESTQVSYQENGRRLQQQGRWKGVDPVLLLKDEEVFESLISYYGIQDSFPLRGHLVTRSEDISRLKRIYYVSKSVRDIIEINNRTAGQLKITSAGLKIFVRLCSFDLKV